MSGKPIGFTLVICLSASTAFAQQPPPQDPPVAKAADAAAPVEEAPTQPGPAVAEPAPATPTAAAAPAAYAREENCTDRVDNDNDGVVDCGDSDCEAAPNCKPGQGQENSNTLCSDWVDNDGDGHVDCDDSNCQGAAVTVCQGSWRGALETGGGAASMVDGGEDVPELGEGQTVEDLIGTGSDKDGERNDHVCADGLDNDGDGRIDCADFGCRFDPSVSVCRGNPGMRFSVVGGMAQFYNIRDYRNGDGTMDTRFTRLQLRTFGPIPLIDNSFFFISSRWEKTPRLTFAMFQVPLAGNHKINLNSGGGGLSLGPIVGFGKHLLDEPAFYVTSAFQGGNGAAAEIQGPLLAGALEYRAYLAGGAGRFTGNVGGRYFTYDNTNYTWSVGGLVQWNIIGVYSQWDVMRLYTPAPATLAVLVGAKFDQRASEQFPAAHIESVLRLGRVVARAEGYMKWAHAKTLHGASEVDFKYAPWAWNVQLGYLLWSKRLMLAADYGVFTADISDIDGDQIVVTNLKDSDLRRQLNEDQVRACAHVYVQRNIGIVSLCYKSRRVENPAKTGKCSGKDNQPTDCEQIVKMEAQYRF